MFGKTSWPLRFDILIVLLLVSNSYVYFLRFIHIACTPGIFVALFYLLRYLFALLFKQMAHYFQIVNIAAEICVIHETIKIYETRALLCVIHIWTFVCSFSFHRLDAFHCATFGSLLCVICMLVSISSQARCKFIRVEHFGSEHSKNNKIKQKKCDKNTQKRKCG